MAGWLAGSRHSLLSASGLCPTSLSSRPLHLKRDLASPTTSVLLDSVNGIYNASLLLSEARPSWLLLLVSTLDRPESFCGYRHRDPRARRSLMAHRHCSAS
jgi:hypothetical protein